MSARAPHRHGRDPVGDRHYSSEGLWGSFILEQRLPASIPLRLLKTRQPAGGYPDPPMAEVSLQIATACRSAPFQYDMGLGVREGRMAPGLMGLSPAHTACDYHIDCPFELLIVNMPAPWLRDVFEECDPHFTGGDFGATHEAFFRNEFVQQLAERLWAEAAQDNPLGTMFLESGAITLATALLRLSSHGASEVVPSRGLAPWRLRRVLDCMNAHLAEDLSLEQCAKAAGLSPWHFARCFRQATGVSPVRYFQERRIERAKEMLSNTNLTLAEVAFSVGFKDQSHFGAVFRRIVGATPGRYRQERRS